MDSQFDPVECTDENCGGKEVSGEFAATGDDAPLIHDATEVVLDLMTVPIDALGAIGFLSGVAAAGDDVQGTFIADLLTHLVSVVGLVGGCCTRRGVMGGDGEASRLSVLFAIPELDRGGPYRVMFEPFPDSEWEFGDDIVDESDRIGLGMTVILF